MLKKTTLIVLCLNLLTPKPVTAVLDPFTWTIIYCAATGGSGVGLGWLWGNSGKAKAIAAQAKAEAETRKIRNEIKVLKAEIEKELEARKADSAKAFRDCLVSDKRRSYLSNVGISDVCEQLDESMRIMQSLSPKTV